MGEASDFSLHHAGFRHNVGGRAAFDQAYVAGGILIQMPLGHLSYGFRCRHNGMNSFFRLKSCMGGLSLDGNLEGN